MRLATGRALRPASVAARRRVSRFPAVNMPGVLRDSAPRGDERIVCRPAGSPPSGFAARIQVLPGARRGQAEIAGSRVQAQETSQSKAVGPGPRVHASVELNRAQRARSG